MKTPDFTKTVIGRLENPQGPGDMNTLLAVGDVDRDGYPDVVVSGRHGRMAWFANPRRQAGEWVMHLIDEPGSMECGGCLYDLNGDGLPDLLNGNEAGADGIFWWENPGPAGGRWTRREIVRTGHGQFHDTVVGDGTGDGTPSLFFTNQQGGTFIYRVPLPHDPYVSPWPGLERVNGEPQWVPNPFNPRWNPEGRQPEEGLAIGDVDGDGRNEVVCGTHWYKHDRGKWLCHRFAPDTYMTTKVAVGDLDGDGRNEIVLAEGDALIYGKQAGCTLAWFKPGGDVTKSWTEHVIETGLYDAHSLQLGPVCGTGRLDILSGEIGSAGVDRATWAGRPPRLTIFGNLGDGRFERYVIDEGTGTHDAVLVDTLNRGVLDIVGKPLHGPERWNIHVWYSGAGGLVP